MSQEVIKHAALIADNGMILLGKSHADCFRQAAHIGVKASSKAVNQGFFTNKGRFVSRDEGAKIASEAQQIDPPSDFLFSEDLWSPSSGGKFKYDSILGYVLKTCKCEMIDCKHSSKFACRKCSVCQRLEEEEEFVEMPTSEGKQLLCFKCEEECRKPGYTDTRKR